MAGLIDRRGDPSNTRFSGSQELLSPSFTDSPSSPMYRSGCTTYFLSLEPLRFLDLFPKSCYPATRPISLQFFNERCARATVWWGNRCHDPCSRRFIDRSIDCSIDSCPVNALR